MPTQDERRFRAIAWGCVVLGGLLLTVGLLAMGGAALFMQRSTQAEGVVLRLQAALNQGRDYGEPNMVPVVGYVDDAGVAREVVGQQSGEPSAWASARACRCATSGWRMARSARASTRPARSGACLWGWRCSAWPSPGRGRWCCA